MPVTIPQYALGFEDRGLAKPLKVQLVTRSLEAGLVHIQSNRVNLGISAPVLVRLQGHHTEDPNSMTHDLRPVQAARHKTL